MKNRLILLIQDPSSKVKLIHGVHPKKIDSPSLYASYSQNQRSLTDWSRTSDLALGLHRLQEYIQHCNSQKNTPESQGSDIDKRGLLIADPTLVFIELHQHRIK